MSSAEQSLNLVAATALAVVLILAFPDDLWSAEPGQQGQVSLESPPGELDLDGLTAGLRDTRAISFVAKLEVKHKAEQLFSDMQRFHDGRGNQELSTLRARFDALLAWLVELVSPADPQLQDRLLASRNALWHKLADPVTFQPPNGPRAHGGLDQGR